MELPCRVWTFQNYWLLCNKACAYVFFSLRRKFVNRLQRAAAVGHLAYIFNVLHYAGVYTVIFKPKRRRKTYIHKYNVCIIRRAFCSITCIYCTVNDWFPRQYIIIPQECWARSRDDWAHARVYVFRRCTLSGDARGYLYMCTETEQLSSKRYFPRQIISSETCKM